MGEDTRTRSPVGHFRDHGHYPAGNGDILNNVMHASDRIKSLFQKIYSDCTFWNGFKGGKIGPGVNLEAIVVDKDDDDGDSVADTVLVIVMYYVIQFSSQL